MSGDLEYKLFFTRFLKLIASKLSPHFHLKDIHLHMKGTGSSILECENIIANLRICKFFMQIDPN